MAVVLTNALLVDLDPPRVEGGMLRIEAGCIAARGRTTVAQPADEIVDCRGAVVLPGLVNGHTHLYSALAVGMPPPPRVPRDFPEILRLVWWRLDQALDAESIESSARIGAISALRCGTTTLIDHHASPNCITGSLDSVERGLSAVGVRGVLCYETTDRHGRSGRDAGLQENGRYLEKHRRSCDERFAGLVGGHASFTLDDESLSALGELAERCAAGVHIHVAEDPCDEADARRRNGAGLVDRLEGAGLLRTNCIFAHGTHLAPDAVARVNAAGVTMAHNARSNMNNAVGYAPTAAFRCPVMLGTDGIGADMFAEARAAWMISRHQRAGLSPSDIVGWLAAAARRASQSLGVTLGKLDVGAAADVVVTDYVPFTQLTDQNVADHFLFGMSSNHIRGVIVGGEWKLNDGIVVQLDETAARSAAQMTADRLWSRMAAIPI